MNADDLASMSPAELIELKAALDERLEIARQQQIQAAAALGLTVVNGTKRKRKSGRQNEVE